MSNYKYAIKKLPIKSWIKYWLWRNRTGGTKYKFALSDIKEGSNFYLENTIKRKFNIFEIFGYTYQDGTPTPENPIPIINLTGNINEKIQNANLVDIEELLNQNAENVVKNADGSYTFTPKGSSYNTGYPVKIPVPSKYSYKIKNETGVNFRLRFVYEDGTVTDGQGNGTGSEEVSINNQPSAIHGDVVEIRCNWTTRGTFTIREFMFNKGTTALPYIPHAEQNISFPLAEGQYFAEGDYLADDGIHHVRKQAVISIERIITINANGNKAGIVTLSDKKFFTTKTILCTNCTYSQTGYTPNTFYENPGNIVMVGTTEDTLETLREKYNGGIIEYDLAEEYVEPFTEEQAEAYNKIKELYTYNEVTNIDGNANLKIKYWERVER